MAKRTLGDLATELMVRLGTSTTVSTPFLTDAIVYGWIKDANTWASADHKWPFTEGRVSTTYSTALQDEYGNVIVPYPEAWKGDSVRFMTIGQKKMTKLLYDDLLRFKEDSPSDTDRVYADYARQLFVNSASDVSGTLTMYGQYTPIFDITDLTQTTIFSDYDEEANEAIIREAMSYMRIKEKNFGEAEKLHESAKQYLDEVWKRVQAEQNVPQKKNGGMFERFDVLDGGFRGDSFKRDQF